MSTKKKSSLRDHERHTVVNNALYSLTGTDATDSLILLHEFDHWTTSSHWTDLNAVSAGAELAHGEVQTHPDSTAHPEGGVERLGEAGAECVQMCHVIGHAVECQRPRRQVQEDAHARGVGDGYVPLLVVVHGYAAGVRQLQGPGLGIVPES